MGRIRRLPAVAVAATALLLSAACQGDDDSGGSVFEPADSESADDAQLPASDQPDVDVCALGADTITDIYPSAKAKPSNGQAEPYDCLWSGHNPSVYTGIEVSVAIWHAEGYTTLEQMRSEFGTDMTTFRPLSGLGDEGWYKDSFSGDEVSWRAGDFTVSVGGIVSEELSEQELIRFARAIDADLTAM